MKLLVESVDIVAENRQSTFIKQEMAQSDRPELAVAKGDLRRARLGQ